MTFKLDTSGSIHFATPYAKSHGLKTFYRWEDLTPFVQGYIEEVLEHADQYEVSGLQVRHVGFSDLANTTLARIIEDCAEFTRLYGEWPLPGHGRGFWIGRQRGSHSMEFMPLTVALNDAGKVVFQ